MDAVKFIEERNRMCESLVMDVLGAQLLMLARMSYVAHLIKGQRWTLRIRLLWSRIGLLHTRARHGRACFLSTGRMRILTVVAC